MIAARCIGKSKELQRSDPIGASSTLVPHRRLGTIFRLTPYLLAGLASEAFHHCSSFRMACVVPALPRRTCPICLLVATPVILHRHILAFEQRPRRSRDVILPHQAFADKESTYACRRQSLAVGVIVDAAFTDQQRTFRYERR